MLLAVTLSLCAALVLWSGGASAAPADSAVTIQAFDFTSGNALANFTFVINEDNSRFIDPANGQARDPKTGTPVGVARYMSTESNSPIVAIGGCGSVACSDELDRKTVSLPAGRYLISVRALNHKLWGRHITLPRDAGNVRIDLTRQGEANPLPLGKISVFVFNDNRWLNGAPDTEEDGLQGFQVGLEEQTHSEVTVDYNNNPLCGGICNTDANGAVTMSNLGPATYFVDVHAPESCVTAASPGVPGGLSGTWQQTTTIDGGLQLQAGVEEGSDGTGALGEQTFEPANVRTAYWFGFACVPDGPDWPATGPFSGGTAEITGTARNWQGWPPFDILTMGEPVEDPFVALSEATTDVTVWSGRGDGAGNFDITGVPAGDYNLAVWDEQLTYIMRFKTVHVEAGAAIDVNETDVNNETGLGVSRWFGWLDGVVFKDFNGNQIQDPGEPGIANTDMDQRWRDGSIKEGTFTDPNGYYVYPTAEGGPLGKWIINEQGFARFGVSGSSVHDEHTGAVTAVPTDLGGALLNNQLVTEGHRATVDWGKVDYPAGEPGQIVGVTYFATTRNEFDASLQAHEDYEAAVPDVTVLLEGLGDDETPNTDDDVVLNEYVTDHWQHPSTLLTTGTTPTGQTCNPIRDAQGNDITGTMNPNIGPGCIEVPINGEQTLDGAFDGGFAFADYCPGGYDLGAHECEGGVEPEPLVAGEYIVHVLMPSDDTDSRPCNPDGESQRLSEAHGPIPASGTTGCLYRVVREEDVNVDLGDQFTPAIPPPPCNGDDHVLDQSTLVTRSPLFTRDQNTSPSAPLCDKHLVTLQNGQNFNADFNLMTNFRTDPNGADPPVANAPEGADALTGDIAEPGRIIGLVSDDIYFERNPQSPWYGEPRPIRNIPVGIYMRVDTVPNVATGKEIGVEGAGGPTVTYDANNWRLFTTVTTSAQGTYEAILPSTQTYNCPIPQGPCPGMYLVKVNDPGSKLHPNSNYNPNLLTATTAWDVWPGLTDQLDTPLDPISGVACEDPAVEPRPELLQVSKPYVNQDDTGTARRITILADFIGSQGPSNPTGGRVTLTDVRTGSVETLTRANGGVVSWTPGSGSTPDTIVIQVPALSFPQFRPGPKQLTIITANGNGGVSSVNGITVHVRGSNSNPAGQQTVTYNPPVVTVNPPPPNGSGSIQAAINGAAAGSLIVLSPGIYNENVLMWKPVKLQGLGPGGIIGAHELQGRDAEDARFHVVGSVIDGRFWDENATAFNAEVTARGGFGGNVPHGADVTVVAQSGSAYGSASGSTDFLAAATARIDGLGLMLGRGQDRGAGGVQLHDHINNMQITNDVLENNGGIVTGGIGIGEQFTSKQNHKVRMLNNRLIGNGGLSHAGGIGIWNDSDNYEIAASVICSNFSRNYGAGVTSIGRNPGSIHDNAVIYNESVDAGGGLSIQSEVSPASALGAGTGNVDIDRNLIQSNFSGDDGGGIYLLNALTFEINVRNNMIVDNGAANVGGAMTMLNSSHVRFVNNTVANNVSTASGEGHIAGPVGVGVPHAAGLASEANTSTWQTDSRYAAQYPNAATRPDFSRPDALFNNIFWENNAFTLSADGPGATLVDQGFIDFEIFGTANNADTFTPRFSDLTNGQILVNGTLATVPGGQGNTSGDPNFVTPFVLELTVSGSRLDPQVAAVTITGADPPVGLTGDYHIDLPTGTAARLAAAAASQVIDRGVRCSNTSFPLPLPTVACSGGGIQAPLGTNADYDGQFRPVPLTVRIRSPWDLGADESPLTP